MPSFHLEPRRMLLTCSVDLKMRIRSEDNFAIWESFWHYMNPKVVYVKMFCNLIYSELCSNLEFLYCKECLIRCLWYFLHKAWSMPLREFLCVMMKCKCRGAGCFVGDHIREVYITVILSHNYVFFANFRSFFYQNSLLFYPWCVYLEYI